MPTKRLRQSISRSMRKRGKNTRKRVNKIHRGGSSKTGKAAAKSAKSAAKSAKSAAKVEAAKEAAKKKKIEKLQKNEEKLQKLLTSKKSIQKQEAKKETLIAEGDSIINTIISNITDSMSGVTIEDKLLDKKNKLIELIEYFENERYIQRIQQEIDTTVGFLYEQRLSSELEANSEIEAILKKYPNNLNKQLEELTNLKEKISIPNSSAYTKARRDYFIRAIENKVGEIILVQQTDAHGKRRMITPSQILSNAPSPPPRKTGSTLYSGSQGGPASAASAAHASGASGAPAKSKKMAMAMPMSKSKRSLLRPNEVQVAWAPASANQKLQLLKGAKEDSDTYLVLKKLKELRDGPKNPQKPLPALTPEDAKIYDAIKDKNPTTLNSNEREIQQIITEISLPSFTKGKGPAEAEVPAVSAEGSNSDEGSLDPEDWWKTTRALSGGYKSKRNRSVLKKTRKKIYGGANIEEDKKGKKERKHTTSSPLRARARARAIAGAEEGKQRRKKKRPLTAAQHAIMNSLTQNHASAIHAERMSKYTSSPVTEHDYRKKSEVTGHDYRKQSQVVTETASQKGYDYAESASLAAATNPLTGGPEYMTAKESKVLTGEVTYAPFGEVTYSPFGEGIKRNRNKSKKGSKKKGSKKKGKK